MPTSINRALFNFPPATGREQSVEQAVIFGSPVRSAIAALIGFNVGFTNQERPLNRLRIDANVSRVEGTTVFIRANFLLRYISGRIDDPYEGLVDVAVIADVA